MATVKDTSEKFFVTCSHAHVWEASSEAVARDAMEKMNKHISACSPHRLIRRTVVEQDITNGSCPTPIAQLSALRWAMGYVENGTDRAVLLVQDDATKIFFLRLGSPENTIRSNSFEGLLNELVAKWERERDED